ncbi:hypothetical protein KR074_002846, partial [Drosophila pseudoananassae]
SWEMLFVYLREPVPPYLLTSPEAFHYFEVAMLWIGWMPPKKLRFLYWISSTFIYMWSAVYLPVGITISFFMDIRNLKASELMTILQLFFNSVGMPFKVLFFRLYIERFHQAKEILSRMDRRCTDVEERMEVHRWAVRCNYAYLIYQMIYTCYTISTVLSSAMGGALPWRIYNPLVDWQKDTLSFWEAALHEGVLMLFAVTQTLMSDVYPLLYGLILRAHIKLLRLRVEKLCMDPAKSSEDNYGDLVMCIKDHQLIHEFVEMIRPAITRTIFIQFLLIGICLGISFINILFFADVWTALATVAYITGIMVQTFPFCYVCDLMKSDCDLLEMSIFHSNWLSSSREYKRTLIYFLHKSQKPVAFTAGSMFPISTSSNIQVAKLAFTVVTFVNQMNLADKLK